MTLDEKLEVAQLLDEMGVYSQGRRVYAPDGSLLATCELPQVMTSWAFIYRYLREQFPAVAYHGGKTLVGLEQHANGVTARFADGDAATRRDAAARVGNYRLTGATLVVTIEPCLMCVGALVHARAQLGLVVALARTPVGRRITQLILDARCSQAHVARLLGLPKSTFNQMVTGRMPAPLDLEARVARVLRGRVAVPSASS